MQRVCLGVLLQAKWPETTLMKLVLCVYKFTGIIPVVQVVLPPVVVREESSSLVQSVCVIREPTLFYSLHLFYRINPANKYFTYFLINHHELWWCGSQLHRQLKLVRRTLDPRDFPCHAVVSVPDKENQVRRVNYEVVLKR